MDYRHISLEFVAAHAFINVSQVAAAPQSALQYVAPQCIADSRYNLQSLGSTL
jgi:hypothetical protein